MQICFESHGADAMTCLYFYTITWPTLLSNSVVLTTANDFWLFVSLVSRCLSLSDFVYIRILYSSVGEAWLVYIRSCELWVLCTLGEDIHVLKSHMYTI